MSLIYVGSLSVGAFVPIAGQMQLMALAQIQPKIAGALKISAALTIAPPTFAATIAASVKVLASLQAQVGLPVVTLQASAVATLIAQLQAQLALLLGFGTLLGAAGVHGYAYDGRADGLGPELNTALISGLPGEAGAAQHTNALILATTLGATWTAMSGVFRTN